VRLAPHEEALLHQATQPPRPHPHPHLLPCQFSSPPPPSSPQPEQFALAHTGLIGAKPYIRIMSRRVEGCLMV
jgi:hypothetical protein